MAKKHHSRAAGKKFVAQLELPEPAPAPKSRKAKKEENNQAQPPPPPKDSMMVQGPSTGRVDEPSEAALSEQALPTSLPHLSTSRRLTSTKHVFGAALRKEKERQCSQREDGTAYEAAPLKILAQFGTIMMRPDEENWPKLTSHAHDPSELQASFRKYSHLLKTEFLPRLTSSASDAASLFQLARGETPSTPETDAQYEIFVRDVSGDKLKVTVDAFHKSAYRIKRSDQIIGEALSHFPMHVWDARFLLVEIGLESDTTSSQAIKDFIISMETDQKAPSFRANLSLGIRIDHVLVKRTFRCDIGGDIQFFATEVQSLSEESLEDRRHNFRALVRNEEDMIAEQRLWWEAGLETFDLQQADTVQAKVNGMIEQMDAVGLDNKGPFVRSKCYVEDAAEPDVPEIPFW